MGLPLLGSLSVWLPAQVPQDPNANALFRRQGTQHQPLRKTWLFSTTRRPAPWIFPRNHGPQGGRWCCPCLVCKNGGGPNVTKSDSSTKHTIYYTVYIYNTYIMYISTSGGRCRWLPPASVNAFTVASKISRGVAAFTGTTRTSVGLYQHLSYHMIGLW